VTSVKVVFALYVLVIVAGLVVFSIVGLTHN
jgi:hypothetical protein